MKDANFFTLATIGLLCFAASPCPAAIIANHATTYLSGEAQGILSSAGGFSDVVDDAPDVGAYRAASDSSVSALGDRASGSASGSASSALDAFGTLSLSTAVSASETTRQYGIWGTSYMRSHAQWDDILFISNTDPRLIGNTLRITFHVIGSMDYEEVEETGQQGGTTQKRIEADSDGNGDLDPTASTYVSFDDGFGLVYEGDWDAFAYKSEFNTLHGFVDYEGFMHIDVPIYENDGYYPGVNGSVLLSIRMETQAGVYQTGIGSGNAHASDPLTFASITLPDVGNVTPESLGVNLTFDSGMRSPNLQASVVPEPASLTTWGLGLLGMAIVARRRKKVTSRP